MSDDRVVALVRRMCDMIAAGDAENAYLRARLAAIEALAVAPTICRGCGEWHHPNVVGVECVPPRGEDDHDRASAKRKA